MKRKHFYFSGKVQGVGFRYTMTYNAKIMGLTGFVKNLYDGRVEAEIQGDEKRINLLIEKMKNTRFIEIDEIIVDDMDLLDEKDFFER